MKKIKEAKRLIRKLFRLYYTDFKGTTAVVFTDTRCGTNARHFYTDDEIAFFRAKWKHKALVTSLNLDFTQQNS